MHKQMIKLSLALVVMIAHSAAHSMLARQVGQRLIRTTRTFVRHQHEAPKRFMTESEMKRDFVGGIPFTLLTVGATGLACYAAGVDKEHISLCTAAGGIVTSLVITSQVSPMALAGSVATSGAIIAGSAAKRYYDENIKTENKKNQ